MRTVHLEREHKFWRAQRRHGTWFVSWGRVGTQGATPVPYPNTLAVLGKAVTKVRLGYRPA